MDSKHVPWTQWVPDGVPLSDLLSHDELMAEIKRRGITVTASSLVNWRKDGIIPRPVRMYHKGNTRPVYPDWYPDLIVKLKTMQAGGKRLSDITPLLRETFATPSVLRPEDV